MERKVRYVFAIAAVCAVGAFAFYSTPAKAQGLLRSRAVAKSGIVSLPMYEESGGGGDNPLFKAKTRFAFGGDGNLNRPPAVRYDIEVMVIAEQWDGQRVIRDNKIHHNQISTHSREIQTIDVSPILDGAEVSINGGPPVKFTFERVGNGLMGPRMSTNVTVARQTQGQTFGEKVSMQTLDAKGGPYSFDTFVFADY